jgi:hypothetical protein
MADDPKPTEPASPPATDESVTDGARRAVAEAAARAAVDQLVNRISGFADEALGALEKRILGDPALKEANEDPLERIRARYADPDAPKVDAPKAHGEPAASEPAASEPAAPAPPRRSAREEAEAKAREQLAELKRKMGRA